MPSHRSHHIGMMKLAYSPAKMGTTFNNSVTKNRNNSSISCSINLFASLRCRGNSKQLQLSKRVDQQLKETFAVQKASLILTPSLSQMMILILMMLLIASLRLNASNQNQINQKQRKYLDSQSHCLVFMSAFQRIRLVQKWLQQKIFI